MPLSQLVNNSDDAATELHYAPSHRIPEGSRRLYHHCWDEDLTDVLASATIPITDSFLSPTERHLGPGVVWLTERPDLLEYRGRRLFFGPTRQHTTFCVDVPIEDVHRWEDWAPRHGLPMTTDWARELRATLSGEWLVVPRPIAAHEWVVVANRDRCSLPGLFAQAT
jgi:hypothetical protein